MFSCEHEFIDRRRVVVVDSEGVFVFWTGYSISAEIICAGDGDIDGLSLRVDELIYAPL